MGALDFPLSNFFFFLEKAQKAPPDPAVLLPLSFYNEMSTLLTQAYISSLLYNRKTLYNATMLAYISFYQVRWKEALYNARYLYRIRLNTKRTPRV